MQRSAAMVLEVQEQLSEHERRVLAEQSESFEQQWVRMEARFQTAQAEATLAIEHAARDLTAVLYDRVILADQAGSLTHEIDIALKNAEVSLKQSYQVPDTLG
jgi:flagellar hook-basal body complex protein FliE